MADDGEKASVGFIAGMLASLSSLVHDGLRESALSALKSTGEGFLYYYGREVVEILLVCTVAVLLFMKPTEAPNAKDEELTEEEIDQLCDEWQPEPLAPAAAADSAPQPVIMEGPPLPRVTVEGRSLLNMATGNFLGVSGRKDVEEKCAATIRKYGTGACGPRGFYGTIDVHLELEKRLAEFMGTEECIIYSYDVATVSSVIPAFAKRQDVVICDEGCNSAVKQGCLLSRSHFSTFAHNDSTSLEAVIRTMEGRLKGRPLTRRFVVVEGVYQDWGDVCPLREVVELANKYKYRVIVDDSIGIGTIGKTGRGTLEHCGLKASDVMAVVGSMGGALGSIGGFCAGAFEVVDHQRLAGAGYCFSAALPPFLATAAIAAIDIIESAEGPALLKSLDANARALRSLLSESDCGLEVAKGDGSPVVMMRLKGDEALKARDEQEAVLGRVATAVRDQGLLVSVGRISSLAKTTARPGLKIMPMALHGEEDVRQAARAVIAGAKAVLG